MGFISKIITKISSNAPVHEHKPRARLMGFSMSLVEDAPPEGDRVRIIKCGQGAEMVEDETGEAQRRGFNVIHNEFYNYRP